MTAPVICFALGALFSWMGWRHWRYRKQETVNLLEVAILKMTGREPLSRTRVDHVLTYIHAFLGLFFGTLLLLIGMVVFLDEMGLL